MTCIREDGAFDDLFEGVCVLAMVGCLSITLTARGTRPNGSAHARGCSARHEEGEGGQVAAGVTTELSTSGERDGRTALLVREHHGTRGAALGATHTTLTHAHETWCPVGALCQLERRRASGPSQALRGVYDDGGTEDIAPAGASRALSAAMNALRTCRLALPLFRPQCVGSGGRAMHRAAVNSRDG